MPKPVPCAVAALLPLLLTLAACGSDSGDSGGSSGGDPIKIAAIAALSGGVSSNPEYGDGAQAAVKSINARGGIKGRQLELVLCDNHQNTTDSAKCNREILADDDVVAIAGGSDNYRDAVRTQLEAARLPVIGQYPVSAFDLTNPLAFNVSGAIVVGSHGLAQAVAASGAKRVGVVTLDIPAADVSRKTVDEVLSKAGIEIVNRVLLAPSTTDLSGPAQQATKGDPDAVIWLSFATQTAVAVKALRATGFQGRIAFTGSAFDREQLVGMGAGGPVSVGLVLPPAWDASTPYVKEFLADMKAYAPEGTVDELALNSWLGVRIFAQAAETLPKVDRAAVLDGLRKLSHVDTGGLTPPVDFAAKPPLSYRAVYNPAYTTVHVERGKVAWDGHLYEFGTGKVLAAAP